MPFTHIQDKDHEIKYLQDEVKRLKLECARYEQERVAHGLQITSYHETVKLVAEILREKLNVV